MPTVELDRPKAEIANHDNLQIPQFVINEAIKAHEHFTQTGLHTTHQEMTEWAKSLQHNPNAKVPTSHL